MIQFEKRPEGYAGEVWDVIHNFKHDLEGKINSEKFDSRLSQDIDKVISFLGSTLAELEEKY